MSNAFKIFFYEKFTLYANIFGINVSKVYNSLEIQIFYHDFIYLYVIRFKIICLDYHKHSKLYSYETRHNQLDSCNKEHLKLSIILKNNNRNFTKAVPNIYSNFLRLAVLPSVNKR